MFGVARPVSMALAGQTRFQAIGDPVRSGNGLHRALRNAAAPPVTPRVRPAATRRGRAIRPSERRTVHVAGWTVSGDRWCVTYLEFHLVFMLPALIVAGLAARGCRERLGPRVSWSVPVLAVLALLWTTGWDNYLVARGVWSYGPDRVLGTIGWVPVEEYAFFLLQPLLTSWTLCALMKHRTPPVASVSRGIRAAGLVAWIGLTAIGAAALGTGRGTYMGLILTWAAPVAAAQWAFAAASIRRRLVEAATTVLGVTLYLCVADAIAIRSGIWTIRPGTSTGLTIAGLPVEEALFFLVTNVLIAQGLLLFLDPPEKS